MLIGKIYADWCGACQQFDPLWQELKLKHGGKHEFREYNQGDKNDRSIAVDGHYVEYEGFPTIFKIDKGKVHTFADNRERDKLEKWFEPKQKRTRKRRSRKSRKRRKNV
jgi:thiol-disulfide isomerase/thioredoxin